jgi:hypothetical protein
MIMLEVDHEKRRGGSCAVGEMDHWWRWRRSYLELILNHSIVQYISESFALSLVLYVPLNNEFPILCQLFHRLHVNFFFFSLFFNPILHTAWLDNRPLTLKSNTAKYYFCEHSSYLHTFLKTCLESGKIKV